MNNYKIAIIGLGYVGLPLAVEFAKKHTVIGFDINETRITNLNKAIDKTQEVSEANLKAVIKTTKLDIGLYFTSKLKDITTANVYIITVPTPIYKNKKPNLTPLISATKTVGNVLNENDIVIYESTVSPGTTEEVCVPILESESGLLFNKSFYVGYSPERINPGDTIRTLTKVIKVTSGSTPQIAKKVDSLYKSIITAGTYLAPSIKVAEAAKIIENTQRDVNIAFVNELAKLFNKLDIDTKSVLEAASTKWNFLKFYPGLVGGHCIGVDPYYLAEKAIAVGYNPEMILSGRKINDSMGAYVAKETIKLMLDNNISLQNANVLVLGITFKENCSDIRNSRVIDSIKEFKKHNINVEVFDPHVSLEEVNSEYDVSFIKTIGNKTYDAIVLAVAHNEFYNLNLDLMRHKTTVVYDVKSILPISKITARL